MIKRDVRIEFLESEKFGEVCSSTLQLKEELFTSEATVIKWENAESSDVDLITTETEQEEITDMEEAFKFKHGNTNVGDTSMSGMSTLPQKEHCVDENSLACSLVGISFNSPGLVQDETTLPSKLFTCDLCGASYGHRNSLKRHKLSHTRGKEYGCLFCGLAFMHYYALKEHQLTQRCQKLRKAKNDQENLRENFDEDQNDDSGMKKIEVTLFQCSICNKYFTTSIECKNHQLSHEQLKLEPGDESTEVDYDNSEQMFTFPTLENEEEELEKDPLASETSINNSVPTFDQNEFVEQVEDQNCDNIGETFILSNLEEYDVNSSNDSGHQGIFTLQNKTQGQVFGLIERNSSQCSNAAKIFKQMSQIGKNVALPFKCGTCGERFPTLIKRNGHEMTHANYRPFKCCVCGKGFITKEVRNDHELVHKEKITPSGTKFFCDICGRTFTKPNALNYHVKHNHKEKEYECSDCGKRFMFFSSLQNHRKVHLKESRTTKKYETGSSTFVQDEIVIDNDGESFNCSKCGKQLADAALLDQHTKLFHEGAKDVDCVICGKKFTSTDGLKKHTVYHTDANRYKCPTCGKGFPIKIRMVMHSTSHWGKSQ